MASKVNVALVVVIDKEIKRDWCIQIPKLEEDQYG